LRLNQIIFHFRQKSIPKKVNLLPPLSEFVEKKNEEKVSNCVAEVFAFGLFT